MGVAGVLAVLVSACTVVEGAAPPSTPTAPTTAAPPSEPVATVPVPDRPYLVVRTVDEWVGGRAVDVELHNPTGAPVYGWTVGFDWQVTVTAMWNAVDGSSPGRVVATNAAWNTVVPAGGAVSFGMTVATTSSPAIPTLGTCNSVPCEVRDGGVAGAAPSPTTTAPATSVPGGAPTTTAPVPTTAPGGKVPGTDGRIAPYVDMGLWPTPDLVTVAAGSGVSRLALAFVQSRGGCAPAWFGIVGVGSPEDDFAGRIAALRAAGGDVVLSFGGASGVELAQACSTDASLTAAYRSVVDAYLITSIDLDVEGAAVAEPASVARRSRALARLQSDLAATGRGLEVSLTLPVLPTGLTADGLAVVQSAVAAGVDLAAVNLMAMDYGDSAAPSPDGRMGAYAIDAARATAAQLASVYPGTTTAQRLRKVGLTPMIGRNDVPSEYFSVADAEQVGAFVAANGLGRLAWWSTGRDRPCPGGPSPWASPTCSGGADPQWAFAAAFRAGAGL
jgi:hypothetical protein